jgi:hypothetical protein
MIASIKAAWARFSAEFWLGYEAARAKAKQQPPAPLIAEPEFRDWLLTIIRDAYADGVAAERKHVSDVLNAPGAATFPTIAIDLALGEATATQAAAVLARAEADAATRAAAIKSNLLESTNVATLH